jgi:hypothetical protein
MALSGLFSLPPKTSPAAILAGCRQGEGGQARYDTGGQAPSGVQVDCRGIRQRRGATWDRASALPGSGALGGEA